MCIQKWLRIKKTCPVCRTPIQYTSTSIAVDNFISNMCHLIGGFIKKRRESVQNAHLGISYLIIMLITICNLYINNFRS